MKTLTLTTLALSTLFLLGISSPSQAGETSYNDSNIILVHGGGHHSGHHGGRHHGGHHHHGGWGHHGGWNRGWGGGWNGGWGGGYNFYTTPAPCVGPLCPLIW